MTYRSGRSGTTILLLPLASALAAAAGCPAPDGVGPTTTPEPEGYPATWAGMEQLFTDNCDRCHPAQQGLDLHTGIPEDIAGDQLFVVPGDSENSLMWLQVSGQTTLNMPLDGTLDLGVVAPMQEWIDAGAVVD